MTRETATRAQIALLIYLMTQGVLFGAGVILVMTWPALSVDAGIWISAVVAASFILAAPIAWWIAELSANQITDQFSARTARIKADLRLTPEQEKNCAGFESVMNKIGKTSAEREVALQTESTQQKGPVDVIERMRKDATYLGERSVNEKTLADAAQPLYAPQRSAETAVCRRVAGPEAFSRL